MKENDKTEARARVKPRSSYQISNDTGESNKAVNTYTMFIIGATALFTGFWALACLVNATLQDGPLTAIRHLATAITGH